MEPPAPLTPLATAAATAATSRAALHRLIDAFPDEVLPEAARHLEGLAQQAAEEAGVGSSAPTAPTAPDPQAAQQAQEAQEAQATPALIERWIERNPAKPWLDEAQIVTFGVPVWALIGHLRGTGEDVSQTATAYDLPPEAVEAALAFYGRHRAVIDARLEANVAQPDDPL